MQTFNIRDLHHALAVKLYQEGVLSLGKAARVADLPVERFLDVLSAAGVDAVAIRPRNSTTSWPNLPADKRRGPEPGTRNQDPALLPASF